MRKLLHHAREAFQVPRDLLLRRYPPFVTGGELPRGHVPVFVFHSLHPSAFGQKLRYLADNGYVTLSAGEYHDVLLGNREAPEKAVLLTIDDGRESVWSVGYPLLERHGMRAVVFLVPGRVEARPRGPWPAEPLRPPSPNEGFLCWQEIEALAKTGLLEFQSHTLSHGRIHVSPQLAGFFTPEDRGGYRSLDVPWIHANGGDLAPAEIPLGTPLLRSEPRTSESLRFYEDAAVRRLCVEAVADGGGEGFFLRSDWQRTLRRLLSKQHVGGRLETPNEREAAIRNELARAKELIEAHTGRSVVHLCYPWHSSGPTARRIADEVGYRTAFCGKVEGVPLTPPGGDPMAIARIGEDYVELLPGRGRADIASILRMKWNRRLAGKS